MAEEVEVFVGAGEGELFVDQVVVAVEEEVAWNAVEALGFNVVAGGLG